MAHEEFSFRTMDGLEMFSQSWLAETDSKTFICLIHGLGEHSSRYKAVAERLTSEGFNLVGFDLRGHGRSAGARGDTPSFEAYMQDIEVFREEVNRRYAPKNEFLYGHSLGGLLLLNYLIRQKPAVKGAICSAAGLRTSLTQQRMKLWFVNIFGKIMPKLSIATGLDARMLSHDPIVVERYRKDPLVHGVVTLRMALETLPAIQIVFDQAQTIKVPMLILHGSADQLSYPSGSQELARKVPNNEFHLYEGLFHEIHNEPQKEEVFQTILAWLKRQLQTS
ncbi:MAG: lysophospholipase [Anaerolineales bacterium]